MTLGIISYLHSQNDILSAGGRVHSLSVSIGVPFSENIVESFYLKYFMRGIQIEASKDDAYLAAGHSYQTEEPAVTITMNGSIRQKSKKYETSTYMNCGDWVESCTALIEDESGDLKL